MGILGDDTHKTRVTAKEHKDQNTEEFKLVSIDEDE